MKKSSENANSRFNLIVERFKNPRSMENVLVGLWIIFSLGFLVYMMKTGRVNFETNDDVIMAQITAGVFGEHSPYNVFSNIVLGWILTGLARMMPGHNWPTVMDMGFIAVSYAMIGVVCIKSFKKNRLLSLLLPLTLVLATFKTLIMGINFSKVGAIMFITGFIVLMHSVDNDDFKSVENRIYRIIGCIMFIAGSLVRFDSVKAMLPFMAILVVYFCVKNKSGFKGKFSGWPVWGRLVRLLIPFVAVFILWTAHALTYNTQEWKTYNYYEDLLVNIQDFYGFPDYEAHQSEYEDLGLNEHDSVMFMCYVHADNKVFSTDVIERLEEMAATDFKRDFTVTYIKELIQSVLYLAGNQTVIMIVLLLFVFGALVIDKKYFPYIGAAAFLMLAELGYLYYINRVLERSLVLPALGAFITIIYVVIKNNRLDGSDFSGAVPVTVMVCIMLYAFFTRGMSDIKEIPAYVTVDKESLEALSNELKGNSDSIYIWDYQSYADASMQYASPLDEYPENWMGNSLVLGAWPVEMPLMREIARPFGNPGNLMEILVENPHAYYVFEHTNPYMTVEAMEEYIRDHYKSDAVLYEEETIGGYTVYSVR